MINQENRKNIFKYFSTVNLKTKRNFRLKKLNNLLSLNKYLLIFLSEANMKHIWIIPSLAFVYNHWSD